MSLLFKSLVFVLVTAVLTWVSLPSLRDCRAHGFYRFFAWDAILALILLNLESWFDEPFSFRQLISRSLLIISGYLVIHGTLILHRMGKPSRKRMDSLLYDVEKTTTLVTSGIYRYIRHPMYSSLLFLTWGVYFKNPGLVSICLVTAASGFLIATAKVEESENVRYFGVAYHDYMKQTRMFVPYLF